MGTARNHINNGHLVTVYIEIINLICTDFSHLYKAFAGNHNELFRLGVVPVLTFCNARLGNVYTYLPGILCSYNFSKASSGYR